MKIWSGELLLNPPPDLMKATAQTTNISQIQNTLKYTNVDSNKASIRSVTED